MSKCKVCGDLKVKSSICGGCMDNPREIFDYIPFEIKRRKRRLKAIFLLLIIDANIIFINYWLYLILYK